MIVCFTYDQIDYALELLGLARHLIDPGAAGVMRQLAYAYPQ